MDNNEQQFWKDQFKDLQDRSDAANNKMIKWAEKFGKLATETKTELSKISSKLDQPFYKTWDFWKTVIYILLYITGIILIITKGGCFSIKGFIELGKCNGL